MPFEKRGWDPLWLAKALADPERPVFLMGSVPPREGTSPSEAQAIAEKFIARSRSHATDGFIVYDIQDEASRTNMARPFPFRRTMDPSEFAALFPPASGKSTVLYHAVSEPTEAAFDAWLDTAGVYGHRTLNLVGPASSSDTGHIKLDVAAKRVAAQPQEIAWGAVTIAERHLSKGTEHLNILRKQGLGAQWFISQAVYDADATIKLLLDYSAECKKQGLPMRKIILTFAPCSRPKTMQFIRWLGINVPEDVESRVLLAAETSKNAAVDESIKICCEALSKILDAASGCGVPLGVSVESVSGFKEEIDGCFELFRRLQQILLDTTVQGGWGVRWYRIPLGSMMRSGSESELARLEEKLKETAEGSTKESIAFLAGRSPPLVEGSQSRSFLEAAGDRSTDLSQLPKAPPVPVQPMSTGKVEASSASKAAPAPAQKDEVIWSMELSMACLACMWFMVYAAVGAMERRRQL